MAVIRNDVDEVFANGVLISSNPVARDITEFANENDLRSRAQQALTTNATYLGQPAIPASPTLAQLTAAVRIIRDQVDALTKQNNAIIRLDLRLLDSIDNT